MDARGQWQGDAGIGDAANPSGCTRVSLDFRVGVQGHFDPGWSMRGTVSDHRRAEVAL